MSEWPSGLRRCVKVAVSSGGVGSNPTSDRRVRKGRCGKHSGFQNLNARTRLWREAYSKAIPKAACQVPGILPAFNCLKLTLIARFLQDNFQPLGLSFTEKNKSGWPSGLRRCVQVAVSSAGVGSNPTSDKSLGPQSPRISMFEQDPKGFARCYTILC